jgi:glycine hydroxymethyltransferase
LLEAWRQDSGFDLSHGGHLTHGSPVNFSGRLYSPVFYGVERETGRLDYDKIQEIATKRTAKIDHCRSFGLFT